MAADRVAELGQTLEEFEHFAQLGGRECFAVSEVFQLYLVSTERDEDLVKRGVVVHILFALLALDEIERRAGDVDFALLHEFRHLAVEEGEKQCADVRTVHIGVGHDDDAAVAETGEVKRALLVTGSNASADGRDERLDFGVLKHLVEAGFFDIDDFTFDRKDRLVTAVAALLGRTTGRVALDDIQLGERRVALGAVGQLAGESAAGESAFANGFAGFAGGLASAGGCEAFFNDALRNGGIRVEVGHQCLVGDRANDAFHLWRDEFDLRLGLEPGVRVFNRENADETLAHIVAADRGILVFNQAVGLGVLIDRAGERRAEAGGVRAAIRIRDRVGEAQNLVVVAVVVLQHDIHIHVVLDLGLILVFESDLAFSSNDDRLRMQELLVLAELADELLDAHFVNPMLGAHCLPALVGEGDFEAGIEEGEFAQTGGQLRKLELRCDREDRRVGQESDECAGLFFVFDFTDDGEFLHRHTALESHVVHLAVAGHLDLEPITERIDALGADAVQTARVFIGTLAELAARMEIREHEFECGDFEFRMDVHRNAAAVVLNRAGSIDMNGDIDFRAEACQVFVDRVVEHLEHAMVQAAFICRPDIHAGALAHAGEAFEFVDFGGVVFFAFGSGVLFFGHQESGRYSV